MKKIVVLYYSSKEAMEKMKTSTPEQMQAGQKDWMDWFAGLEDGLVEQGEFFGRGKLYNNNGSEECTGKVTGYSIIQAESLEDAESMVQEHPHLDWHEGCSLELYEPMTYTK